MRLVSNRRGRGTAGSAAGYGQEGTRAGEAGQSLVEFSLVLTPLLLILLGIIQFGFIFNTYVTMTNAAREGARSGTIQPYDRTCTKAQNDTRRNEAIRAAVAASMNFLSRTSPQYATTPATGTGCTMTGTWVSSNGGLTFTNGDLVISYALPVGVTDSDARTGQQVTVSAVYHQDLIIPLIANLLPRDAGGRLGLTGQVTMVIN